MVGGRRAILGALVAVLVGLGALAVPTAAAADPGDIGYEGASYAGVANPPTADKPQSKLWFHDGLWWAHMFDTVSQDWYIHRLDRSTQTWVKTDALVDTRLKLSSDALWDGQKLYIATHIVRPNNQASATNQAARLYRLSYVPATRTWTVDTGFPTTISTVTSESLTIDKDSTGTVWATWTHVSGDSTTGFTSSVMLNSASNNGASWGTAFQVPTTGGVNPSTAQDDISAIVAFGGDKIGLLWSNQNDETVYWSVHRDGTARDQWNGGVAVRGNRQADDHLNIKSLQSDTSGRVYAVVKTSVDQISNVSPSEPLIKVLHFKPATGAWTETTFGTLADCHTRPQLVLDETNQQVHVVASGPTASGTCTNTGSGTIYHKSAPMSDPVFAPGVGTPIIRDASDEAVNNATITKQGVTAASGLVVLASNATTERYWHADMALGESDTTAPTVSGVSPTGGATGVGATTNVTATFSEPMAPATLTSDTFTLTGGGTTVPAAVSYDEGTRTATLNPDADLAAGTSYTATVTTGATDANGNPLAQNHTWTFSTAAASSGEETVTLTAVADTYVASGSGGTNYGTGTMMAVDGSPVEISYLKFDLSAYAGRTVTAATLELRSAGSGSKGTQNIKLVGDDSWTETGLTYNNRPALGTAVGSFGPTSTNTNYRVTLDAAGLQNDLGQLLSLGLDSTSGDGLDLNTRETSTPPRLVLTLG